MCKLGVGVITKSFNHSNTITSKTLNDMSNGKIYLFVLFFTMSCQYPQVYLE